LTCSSVEYLGSKSGEQFAEDCRAAQASQPTSIACELAYLSRKPVAELEQALLRTRARPPRRAAARCG
jgi:hypothetical protein